MWHLGPPWHACKECPVDKFKKMARKQQLEYLGKLDEADLDGVGPKFEEAVLSAAVQYADVKDLVSLLSMADKQAAPVNLLEPKFAQNNLDEVKLCQVAMKAIILERLVPLVAKGADGRAEVLSVAKAMRQVVSGNKRPEASLVFSAYLSELDLIACAILGVLGEAIHGLTAEGVLQKVQSVVKDSGKEGYKFIFRKALEQSSFWKGEVAKYMESAVAVATLVPELESLHTNLRKHLEALHQADALKELRHIIKRLPVFRTSLPGQLLVDVENAVGELMWQLLGHAPESKDGMAALASVNDVIGEFLGLPTVEGMTSEALARVKAAQSHCQEMLQELKAANVEQCILEALKGFMQKKERGHGRVAGAC